MKYALLIGDGMADWPVAALENRTPLEYARTPNMDRVAKKGTIGLVATVPQGMPPGSDVANLSLLGYDPMTYYSGRAPIEAASMGVALAANDTAFRCNLVTIENETMVDYSAGHITTAEAHLIVKELQKHCSTETVRFFPGVSYRHLTVIAAFPEGLVTTPPHDISGKPIHSYLPQGEAAGDLLRLMQKAHEVLSVLEVNKRRRDEGKKTATDIWLWGQGRAVSLPSMAQRYGITGSVISAVDLVRGLGILAGLQVRLVDGATGYLGTNYAGKVAAAREALEEQDMVYVHIEAPDETGHEGVLEKKIQAIEEFDAHIVGEMLRYQEERGDLRILVTPDHATPLAIRTHSDEAIPFALCGPGIAAGNYASYCEVSAQGSPPINGPELFDRFIKRSW
ncbi:MAG: cofactor-independent phosphoglycerate mutase [Chitinispirillaceae bacterium]|nr:cofactor-independent phosphoglycerate mutase [Chitinispirillaceae bacterium]